MAIKLPTAKSLVMEILTASTQAMLLMLALAAQKRQPVTLRQRQTRRSAPLSCRAELRHLLLFRHEKKENVKGSSTLLRFASFRSE